MPSWEGGSIIFQHYPVMAWKNREASNEIHGNGVHLRKAGPHKAFDQRVRQGQTYSRPAACFLAGPNASSTSDLQETPRRVHADGARDAARACTTCRSRTAAERARHLSRGAAGLAGLPRAQSGDGPLVCLLVLAGGRSSSTRRCRRRSAAPSEETRDDWPSSRRGAQALLPLGARVPGRVPRRGLGLRRDPRQPAVGHRQAELEGVLLEHRSAVPVLRQAGGAALPDRVLRGRGRSSGRGSTTTPTSARSRTSSAHAAEPFGDPEGEDDGARSLRDRRAAGRTATLHARWREAPRREPAASPTRRIPFRHQGSADLNLYKLFLEQAHALLRDGRPPRLHRARPASTPITAPGALRAAVPRPLPLGVALRLREPGQDLRHPSAASSSTRSSSQKGGATEAIRTAFMRRELEDWERAESLATPYTRAQVERFSPRSKAILEIQSARDLEILEKIYANSVLLGDDGPDGWGIKYCHRVPHDQRLEALPAAAEVGGARATGPTSTAAGSRATGGRSRSCGRELKVDPSKVVPIDSECARRMEGPDVQKTDRPGRLRCAQPPYDLLPIPRADIPAGIILSRGAEEWIRAEGIEDVALPLYQGVMIHLLETNVSEYLGGAGHRAAWRSRDCFSDEVMPQFLLGRELLAVEKPALAIAFRALARGTDARTFIDTPLDRVPCGNSIGLLQLSAGIRATLTGAALASSFVFDWALRRRVAGTNINSFFLWEAAWPRSSSVPAALCDLSLSLACAGRRFARLWLSDRIDRSLPWRALWAISVSERLRSRCVLDAIAAAQFGIDRADLQHILSDCDKPFAVGDTDQRDPKRVLASRRQSRARIAPACAGDGCLERPAILASRHGRVVVACR